MNKKIGILGGTFDPIHYGHLAVAQTVRDKFALDKVIFVPAFIPPHKQKQKIVSSRARGHMVKLAVTDNKYFDLSNYEINKQGMSYSVETVRHFRDVYPAATELFFIIGEDTAAKLHTWKKIDELKRLVTFVAVNRLGYRSKQTQVKVRSVKMPNLEISSSYLRSCIRNEKPLRYFMPDNVIRYIKKNKLYL